MLGEVPNPITKLAFVRPTEFTRRKDRGTVAQVLKYFDERQLFSSSKPIPARDVFAQRLEALVDGKPVEVVCFNCIDFAYKAKGVNYPQAVALDDTDNALVECYRDELTDAVAQLRRLGNPRVTIVVPDSELTDGNVFNFSQKERDRREIGQRIREELSQRFNADNISVMLWSDFLASRGLSTPEEYTRSNLPLVMSRYKRNVKDMVKDSRDYFLGKGVREDEIGRVSPVEIAIRSAWYLAMYAGEGNAMADLGNVVMLNFENDGKVLTWSQRGAQGYNTEQEVLPIITPADTRRFKSWKAEMRNRRRNVVN